MSRLDVYLYEKGLASSRTRAANLIKLGGVKINGEVCRKAAFEPRETDRVEVIDLIEYASLGGLKLAEAIKAFSLSDFGVCVDLGCSNGGFTDCLLRHGATQVYAVDIGDCAMPDCLCTDSRVTVLDNTDARTVPLQDGIADTVTADLSFISVSLVLTELYRLLRMGGKAVILVKPQFEVGRKGLTKTGIVKDEKLSQRALTKIQNTCVALGLRVGGCVPVPRLFEDKNIEYLVLLNKDSK